MNKKYEITSEVNQLIIDLYQSGLSVISTWFEVNERGFVVTKSVVHGILERLNLLRNARQLKGARIKPVYRHIKNCKHCGNEFKQLFARHAFCDACAPDASWYQRIRRYGVGKREYDKMFLDQNGKCAICEKVLNEFRDTAVDHDHLTGLARGLLCSYCNTRLGILEDKKFVQLAQMYLLKFKTK